MIGEAFDLIGAILPLSKADQKCVARAKKSGVAELQLRGVGPQQSRPRL
jgi:hypothetical protein